MSHDKRALIYNQIASIVADTLTIPLGEIKPESTLESLGADSLDMLEIIMKLEETFNVEIHDDEAVKITTVSEAIDKIYELTAAE